MDGRTEHAWLSFVKAEQAYRESMAALRHVDMIAALDAGLRNLPWRRAALDVLSRSDPVLSESLLPVLFRLASDSHSMIGAVRRCILRVPRESLSPRLEEFVSQLIDDPSSDYEAYRRIAELVDEIGDSRLLETLVGAARASSDPDIREVASDFGEGGERE